MATVRLTTPARADIDAIWDYIAKGSVDAADRLIDEVYKSCATFAEQPQAAAPADRFQPGLRYFPVGN
jgi:plasmid stabilization system protein ParE